MATLKSKITVESGDFFSINLNVNNESTAITSGDDRAFSIEKVAPGVRASSTITMVETVVANLNGDTVILTDSQNNTHTVTFSTDYSSAATGSNAFGYLDIDDAVVANYTGLTLILTDNYSAAGVRVLTITFTALNSVTVKKVSTATAIAYTVGLNGLTTKEEIRDRVVTALTAIKTAGDISITAVADASNIELIKLTQDVVGSGGNTSITGTTISGSKITETNFIKGGLPYNAYYAGITDNAADATAHIQALKNSIDLAEGLGLIEMSTSDINTTNDTMVLSMKGPYTADAGINVMGSAVSEGEITATEFVGVGVPTILPCGEFNSKIQKVYVHGVNRSNTGDLNIYIKDTSSQASGTITANKADSSDFVAGVTLTLISARGFTYTLTSVASAAATANTRTGDLTGDFAIASTTARLFDNISTTLNKLVNYASKEKKPFQLTLDSTGLIATIIQTDIDGGSLGNTTIGGTAIATHTSYILTKTDISGGIDAYHLIASLGPKEHMFLPMAGSPALYCDSSGDEIKFEYLTLEA
jgi:hypothetical protein